MTKKELITAYCKNCLEIERLAYAGFWGYTEPEDESNKAIKKEFYAKYGVDIDVYIREKNKEKKS